MTFLLKESLRTSSRNPQGVLDDSPPNSELRTQDVRTTQQSGLEAGTARCTSKNLPPHSRRNAKAVEKLWKSRKPVGWRQLCAVTRAELEADPTIDNSEWVERIKRRILQLGFTYPEQLDGINRAMRAVERFVDRA
jgi:hypothetical protein